MAYSYSKINTFDNCNLRYRFIYIDKAEGDFENSIESFMGSRVHEALEKLYKDLKFGKEVTLDEILSYYKKEWKKKINDDIKVVKEDYVKKDYLNMGIKYITDYFNHYKPFDQDYTIGLETEVELDLFNDTKYMIKGYIDRLSIKDDVYIVHDYKTSTNLPTSEEINDNKQLAIYALALKEKYPDVKKVELVWHYLAFDKEIRITKEQSDYDKLKIDLKEKIDLIESKSYDDLKPKESTLCNWCEFASRCPLKSHLVRTKQLSLEEFQKDYGVNLVNEYFDIMSKKELLDARLSEIEQKIYDYTSRENLQTLFGSNGSIKVYQDKSIKLPQKGTVKFDMLKKVIIESNSPDYLTVDSYNFVKNYNINLMSEDLKQKVANYIEQKESKRIYVKKNFAN